MKINDFRGTYYFLSNFFPANVKFEGIVYLNNESAFQSMKCTDEKDRLKFKDLTPSESKRLGRRVKLRDDWENVKNQYMYDICMSKFEQNSNLKDKLLKTGDVVLEEGNTWGDKVWGTVNGVGENRLGKILMKVRENLQ